MPAPIPIWPVVRTLKVLVCVGALAMGCNAGDARVSITPRAAPRHGSAPANIRVDVNLVLIPVTVTGPLGAPVPGLPREAFQLFEDGVEQQIRSLVSEDAPVSLGVVLDASRSMEGRLEHARAAILQFFNTTIPHDEFFLVEFNDTPRLLCNFTSNPDLIRQSLANVRPRNWTALLDAVYLAIQQMKHARNPRKALLILSDGGDNNSRYTQSEIRSLVREADVSIYSIAIGGGLIRRHVRLLRQLSEETGGRLWQMDKPEGLPDVVAKISLAIRDQYLLGYSSNRPRNDGLYRKIEVKLRQPSDMPPLRASWRTGYYAPAAE